MTKSRKGDKRWLAEHCLRGLHVDHADRWLLVKRIITLLQNDRVRLRRIIGQGDK